MACDCLRRALSACVRLENLGDARPSEYGASLMPAVPCRPTGCSRGGALAFPCASRVGLLVWPRGRGVLPGHVPATLPLEWCPLSPTSGGVR